MTIHSVPTAIELLEAVKDHLVDLMSRIEDEHDNFQTRVAVRALDLVQSELEQDQSAVAHYIAGLESRGLHSERDLAMLVRDGSLNDVWDLVREGVTLKAEVSDRRTRRAPSPATTSPPGRRIES